MSGGERQKSVQLMENLKAEYKSPKYMKAWSCRSEREALRELVMELSASIDMSSLLLSTRKDLEVTRRHVSKVSTESVEGLKGLILRKDGPCTFVAINLKNARDYYKESAKIKEQDASLLLASLDQGPSSLTRFRAAEKLAGLLKKIRKECVALELLGGFPHPMRISESSLRRMKEALSFQVESKEELGYDTPSAVLRYREDSKDEEVISHYLTRQGYTVVNPLGDPAFLVRVVIRKVVLPPRLWSREKSVVFSVEAMLVDRKSGKVLRKKKVENEVADADIGPVNAPYADTGATDSLIEDLLASLKDSSSEAQRDSDQF